MRYHLIPQLMATLLIMVSAEAAEDKRAKSEITRYCFTRVGADIGADGSFLDMNKHGQVLTYIWPDYAPEWFIWNRRSGSEFIDPPLREQEFFGSINGLNDKGHIVGTQNINPEGTIVGAFFWDRRTDVRWLEPLPGHNSSIAKGINNRGQVLGTSAIGIGIDAIDTRAVIWDRHSRIHALPNLPDSTSNYPVDINEAGQVIGFSDSANGGHGYLWDSSGGIRALPGLPGASSTSPQAINDRGEIVGGSAFGEGQHAVFWSEGSGVVDLGGLPGGMENSYATGINNHRQIVGNATTEDGDRAVIWDSTGRIHNLDELLIRDKPDDEFYRLWFGWKINDAGWILALGLDERVGFLYAFQLIPAKRSPDGGYQCACNQAN